MVGRTLCGVGGSRRLCLVCGIVTWELNVQGASEGRSNIACLRFHHASRGEEGAQHAVRAAEPGTRQWRQRHGPKWRRGIWHEGRDTQACGGTLCWQWRGWRHDLEPLLSPDDAIWEGGCGVRTAFLSGTGFCLIVQQHIAWPFTVQASKQAPSSVVIGEFAMATC